MAGLKLNLAIGKAQRELLDRAEKILGLDFLDGVASVILRRNKERFLRGVNPNNVKWVESKQAKRRRAGLPDSQGISRVGSQGNTLFSTSSLFESIQVLTSRSTKNKRVVSVNPSFTNRKTGASVIKYAVQHQSGKNGLPKRQFLGVNNDDVRIVNLILQKALQGK